MFTAEFYEDHPEDTRKGSSVLGRQLSSHEDTSLSTSVETVAIPGNCQYVLVMSDNNDILVEVGKDSVTVAASRRVLVTRGIWKVLTVGPVDNILGYRVATGENTATLSTGISVGDSTSVKLLDANSERSYIAISARDANIFLKLQTAATDNLAKGIFVPANYTYELHPKVIYTGEISAITPVGTATIHTTEF